MSWPFVLVVVVVAAVGVVLWRQNAAAVRAVLRPGSALGEGPARRRARTAFLVSFAGLFAGPVAPLVGALALVLGLWVQRRLKVAPARDPLDVTLARAAVYNGGAALALSAAVALSVWLASAVAAG